MLRIVSARVQERGPHLAGVALTALCGVGCIQLPIPTEYRAEVLFGEEAKELVRTVGPIAVRGLAESLDDREDAPWLLAEHGPILELCEAASGEIFYRASEARFEPEKPPFGRLGPVGVRVWAESGVWKEVEPASEPLTNGGVVSAWIGTSSPCWSAMRFGLSIEPLGPTFQAARQGVPGSYECLQDAPPELFFIPPIAEGARLDFQPECLDALERIVDVGSLVIDGNMAYLPDNFPPEAPMYPSDESN